MLHKNCPCLIIEKYFLTEIRRSTYFCLYKNIIWLPNIFYNIWKIYRNKILKFLILAIKSHIHGCIYAYITLINIYIYIYIHILFLIFTTSNLYRINYRKKISFLIFFHIHKFNWRSSWGILRKPEMLFPCCCADKKKNTHLFRDEIWKKEKLIWKMHKKIIFLGFLFSFTINENCLQRIEKLEILKIYDMYNKAKHQNEKKNYKTNFEKHVLTNLCNILTDMIMKYKNLK